MRPYRDNPLIVTYFENHLPDGVTGFRFCWEDSDANISSDDLEWVQGDWIYKEMQFKPDGIETKVFLWSPEPIGIECERLGILCDFGKDEHGQNWLEF